MTAKKWLKNAISVAMATIIVALSLPLFPANVDAASSITFLEKDDFDALGLGFNALGNADVSASTLTTRMTLNTAAVEGVNISNTSARSYAHYASSTEEMMLKLGIDYSNSSGFSLPIDVLKVGFSTKFAANIGANVKKLSTTDLYYYAFESTFEKKALNLYDLGDKSILDPDFENAIKTLNKDHSADKIKQFFENWGTHILISYDLGAYMEYTAYLYTYEGELEINAVVQNEMKSSVGAAGVSAEKAKSVSVNFAGMSKSSTSDFKSEWMSYGGDPSLTPVSNQQIKDGSVSDFENDVAAWKSSINAANSTIIPQTTKWISIWELIPDDAEYDELVGKLQEYYSSEAVKKNNKFFDQFTSYKSVKDEFIMTYTSPTGEVAYLKSVGNDEYVAPGSKFNAANMNTLPDGAQLSISGPATLDKKTGIVSVNSGAAEGSRIKITIKSASGTGIVTRTYLVKSEGAKTSSGTLFAGGYGHELRPYIIKTAQQFSNIRNYPSSHYILAADIQLGSFTPIDNLWGSIDGNGYKIYEGTLTTSGAMSEQYNYIGLIKQNNGTIKNLRIEKISISKTSNSASDRNELNVGIVCGRNGYSGVLSNIVVTGCTAIGRMGTWGSNANNTITVNVGGICGVNHGTVSKCGVVKSTIEGNAQSATHGRSATANVGGITGIVSISQVHVNDDNKSIAGKTVDSYAYNNTVTAISYGRYLVVPLNKTTAYSYAGGIVGKAYTESNTIILERCIAYNNDFSASSSNPSGHGVTYYEFGSLVGYIQKGDLKLTNCYRLSSDEKRIGAGTVSSSSSSDLTVDSFTAEGTLSDLNVFARAGWTQPDAGGNLTIAQNTKLVMTGTKTYFVGEPFDLSRIEIKGDVNSYTELGRGTYLRYAKVEGFNTGKVTNSQKVKITFGKDAKGNDLFAEFYIKVVNPTLTGIVVVSEPNKTSYFKGEALNISGLSVVAKYNDGSTKTVNASALTVSGGATQAITASKAITVTYSGKSATFNVEAFDVKPIRLTLDESSVKTRFVVGESFTATGLKGTVTYNKGNTKPVVLSNLKVNSSAYKSGVEGSYVINVSYTETVNGQAVTVSASYTVLVGSITGITVTTPPKKTSYYTSDTIIEGDGMVVKATYSSGATQNITSGFVFTGYDLSKAGDQLVTVSIHGVSAQFRIKVTKVALASIAVKVTPKTLYRLNDTFSISGLGLIAYYNNGKSAEKYSGYTYQVEGYDIGVNPKFTAMGEKTVTVTYTEDNVPKTVTYKVKIDGVHTDADGKWEHDGTNHWHTCSCGTVLDTEAHVGGRATCVARAKCSVCGTEYGNTAPDRHVGDTVIRNAKEATCNKSGYSGDTYCADCGERISVGTALPATGNHVRTEVRDYKPATCKVNGYTGDAYCMDCGTKVSTGTAIQATGDHVDTDGAWESDGGYHYHTCGCGATFDKSAHSGGSATCSLKAECNVCSMSYGSFDRNVHVSTELRNVNAPTCKVNGYTGDNYCVSCNIRLSTGSVIFATGDHVDADGAWESDGVYHYHTCGCGASFDKTPHTGGKATCSERAKCSACSFEYGEYDSDNHKNTELRGGTAADCMNAGYTGDTYCTDCQQKLSGGSALAIDPNNHAHIGEGWSFDNDNHFHSCDCGATVNKSLHSFSDWKTVTEATKSRAGLRERSCSVCGHKHTEAIPQLSDGNNGLVITMFVVFSVITLGLGTAVVVLLIKRK